VSPLDFIAGLVIGGLVVGLLRGKAGRAIQRVEQAERMIDFAAEDARRRANDADDPAASQYADGMESAHAHDAEAIRRALRGAR
jgi:hypothetical protein